MRAVVWWWWRGRGLVRAWFRRWFRPQALTTEQMRALFNETSTLQVKYDAPIKSKFRLTRIRAAVDQWRKRHAA